MSATTIYTCDRCGNEITGARQEIEVQERRIGDVSVCAFGDYVGTRHLCPPCGHKLRAFLRGVPA